MLAISFMQRKRRASVIAAAFLTLALSAEAFAGPMHVTPLRDLGMESQILDVQYGRRRVVRRGRGGNAVAGAALGILALGVGAAIADSQRQEQYYPGYGYPAYQYPAYGYPQQDYGYNYGYDYGYGYGQPQVYAPQRVYRGRPTPQFRNRNDGNYWQQKARQERERNQ